MKVVLSPNPYRDTDLKTARSAYEILRASGVEAVFSLPFSPDGAEAIAGSEGIQFLPLDEALRGSDLLICFGGDGTILHAAKGANRAGVPVLGVNLGSVGFMAELEQGELALLSQLAAGEYTVEPRMMLDVRVLREGKTVFKALALNDAVITKGAVARVVELAVYSDGALISEFSGDGAIICTPTGSTAYSMAAGGPIVEPTAENLIFTPICAHALSAKSFVLGRERVITVRTARSVRKNAYLAVDGGRAVRLGGEDTVEIRRSRRYTEVVKLSSHSFYELMQQKLGGSLK